ncbi:SAM-dependent methyltransferase [Amylibacter marinus]|uniref:SAM-dependent methyltransferase n=1 Tax=Amylibacter marinus TaxID=1475483 RepID=A0ABQ5VT25_9RHOB|nr:RsmB/NOP family class I SAM-dependent RNA methyltransferase [Amylibacter marinus]GLQ34417.1 SAM-dependent methyltransferase [Amylibacter marinus]
MTPNARVAAAIDILGRITAGAPAEKELTAWGRANRFAGSKDRAAVRDITFDCLRNLRSYAHTSGLDTPRGILMGYVLQQGGDLGAVFSGEGYAPVQIDAVERAILGRDRPEISAGEEMNLPDWIVPMVPEGTIESRAVFAKRAPIDLRVNLSQISRLDAQAELLSEGIETEILDYTSAGLRVIGQTRKIPQTEIYLRGGIELQDAGSQLLVDMLPIESGAKVLDLCAGGGGKSLAIASLGTDRKIFAYDIAPQRMDDLALRAKRAKAEIKVLKKSPVGGGDVFDLVLLDVPCSGSGSWRRTPDARWKLSPEKLSELTGIQSQILAEASGLVAAGGTLAYATCSLFDQENEAQIVQFLAENPQWQVIRQERMKLGAQSDGFFVAILGKVSQP